jgi:hypothetical protein
MQLSRVPNRLVVKIPVERGDDRKPTAFLAGMNFDFVFFFFFFLS